MKVIFLDVDGVLNHKGTRSRTESGYYFVDDEKIEILKELIDKSGAEVVLSSDWRKGWYDIDNGKEDTQDARDFVMLRNKLLEYGIGMIDYTPWIENEYRGTQIDLWLKGWKGEPVEKMLILDDYDDMKLYGKYLVMTSSKDGLQKKHMKKGLRILNESK